MERISNRLKRISVIPLNINIVYKGAEMTRNMARTGYSNFNNFAVRKVK